MAGLPSGSTLGGRPGPSCLTKDVHPPPKQQDRVESEGPFTENAKNWRKKLSGSAPASRIRPLRKRVGPVSTAAQAPGPASSPVGSPSSRTSQAVDHDMGHPDGLGPPRGIGRAVGDRGGVEHGEIGGEPRAESGRDRSGGSASGGVAREMSHGLGPRVIAEVARVMAQVAGERPPASGMRITPTKNSVGPRHMGRMPQNGAHILIRPIPRAERDHPDRQARRDQKIQDEIPARDSPASSAATATVFPSAHRQSGGGDHRQVHLIERVGGDSPENHSSCKSFAGLRPDSIVQSSPRRPRPGPIPAARPSPEWSSPPDKG